MLSVITPLHFTQYLLYFCEPSALISFGFLFLFRQETWRSRFLTLALWHFLVPLLLYELQFVLPGFFIYFLGLLLLMISMHILFGWWLDPKQQWNLRRSKHADFEKMGRLPQRVVEVQCGVCILFTMYSVYNLLLLSPVSSPLLEIVSIGSPLIWGMLDFVLVNMFWQRRG